MVSDSMKGLINNALKVHAEKQEAAKAINNATQYNSAKLVDSPVKSYKPKDPGEFRKMAYETVKKLDHKSSAFYELQEDLGVLCTEEDFDPDLVESYDIDVNQLRNMRDTIYNDWESDDFAVYRNFVDEAWTVMNPTPMKSERYQIKDSKIRNPPVPANTRDVYEPTIRQTPEWLSAKF